MNPVLLIAIPLLGALIAVFLKKIDRAILSVATAANVVISLILALQHSATQVVVIGGFKPPYGISLVLDSYSVVGILLLNVIFGLIVLMSFSQTRLYAVILSVALAALNGMILTGDLFNLFVFMEIAAISAYILTSANKKQQHSFNYLVVGSLSSGFFLFGIILVYSIFGSLNMIDIAQKIKASSAPVQAALTLPLVLIFVGLSVEAKLIPFGGWVRGVLKDANPMVGPMMTSPFAWATLLVFGRLFGSLFQLQGPLLTAFTVIAAATLILAESAAFSRKYLRDVLLYSSIAQSGLAALLFLQGLMFPALLILAGNVISKLVLFTIAGHLAENTGTDAIESLRGVFSRYTWLGIGFTVAVLSLIGLPLFYGFAAKLQALIALFALGTIWLPLVILLMAVVESVYFIRLLTILWHAGEEGEAARKPDEQAFPLKIGSQVTVVAAGIAIVLVVAGVVLLALGTTDLAVLTSRMGGI